MNIHKHNELFNSTEEQQSIISIKIIKNTFETSVSIKFI